MTDEQIIEVIRGALNSVAPTRREDWETIAISDKIEALGLDSIATMEMVGYLEDETDQTFPDEDLAKVNALSDLASLVKTGRIS